MPGIIVKEQNHDQKLKARDQKRRQDAVWAKIPMRGPEAAAHIRNIKRRTKEHPDGKPYRKPGGAVRRFVYNEELKKVVEVDRNGDIVC